MLYARFANDNGLDMVEAQRLLMGQEYRTWRMDIEDYIKEIQANGDNELLRELNTLAMRSRITRLDKLYADTLVEIGKLSKDVRAAMDKFLPSAYKDFYYHDLYDIGQKRGLIHPVSRVDAGALENVIRTPWSGKNYSARIWKNGEKLAETIQRTVTAGMHRGCSADELARYVKQRMNVGYSQAIRLVRTELNYVENRAIVDGIKESGMKYYRFVATLDRRTSATCRDHDGRIYPVDDYSPGTNAPPLHPHCRSTVVGSVKGDSKPKGERAARNADGKYIRVPSDMSYAEWYRRYVIASLEQYYKKVTLSSVREEVRRPTGGVNFRQVTTQPNVHVAEGITLKPKQLHELQRRLRDSASVMGIDDLAVLPPVYVANEVQMGTNAPALYNWKQDKIFITLTLLDEEKLVDLQRDGVLPENRLSTMVHELIHWKDAAEYRKRHPDMAGYADWINIRCWKKLVALEKRGYNIEVSQYASDTYQNKQYDEVYTEVRTKQLLERRDSS